MFLMRDALPNLNGTVRFLHAAAGTPDIDIYSNGAPIDMGLSFGNITKYSELPPGKYNIQIYKAGTYDTPIYSESIEIIPNNIITISIVLEESSLALFTLKDANINPLPGKNYLRFINLSPNAPLLTLSLPNDITLFNGVEYLETTGYTPLSPGIYNFLLTATSASALRFFVNNIDLRPTNFHTLYVIGLINDKPTFGSLFIKDGLEH